MAAMPPGHHMGHVTSTVTIEPPPQEKMFFPQVVLSASCEINVCFLLPRYVHSFPFLFRIFCRFWGKMATNDAVLKRLEQKGAEADQIIEYLKQQVALLKEKASKDVLTL